MAVALVIALRLVLPLSILRWPLAGGLLAMAVDGLDVVLLEGFAPIFGEAPEFGPRIRSSTSSSTPTTSASS